MVTGLPLLRDTIATGTAPISSTSPHPLRVHSRTGPTDARVWRKVMSTGLQRYRTAAHFPHTMVERTVDG